MSTNKRGTRYDEEFKRTLVNLYQNGNKSQAALCKEYGVSVNIYCMRHSSRRGNEHTVALPETGPSGANAPCTSGPRSNCLRKNRKQRKSDVCE